MSLAETFWQHVDTSANCWVWTRSKTGNGYGKVYVRGRLDLAHRWAYELYYQHIDPSLTIDHLCKNKLCVNPLHLELVPHHVNNRRSNSRSAVQARQTHCVSGHVFDELNTYIDSRGRRHCRECRTRRMREFKQRRAARERRAAA